MGDCVRRSVSPLSINHVFAHIRGSYEGLLAIGAAEVNKKFYFQLSTEPSAR